MQAIDEQMQELLERMRRHNQFIGAQHLANENAQRGQFFHKSTRADGTAGMQKSLEWPTKIDFSLFDKVAFPSGVADADVVISSPCNADRSSEYCMLICSMEVFL